eukprot:1001323-Rhodomonas_salina.2
MGYSLLVQDLHNKLHEIGVSMSTHVACARLLLLSHSHDAFRMLGIVDHEFSHMFLKTLWPGTAKTLSRWQRALPVREYLTENECPCIKSSAGEGGARSVSRLR